MKLKKFLLPLIAVIAIIPISYFVITKTRHVHEYVDDIVAPTCTKQGYTNHTCECGDSYIDTYVEKAEHTEVVDKAIDATCDKEGKTAGSHCKICEEIIQPQTVVEKLGHAETVSTSGFPATCTKRGVSDEISCSRCNKILADAVAIPPIGHDYAEGACSHCESKSIDYTDVSIYSSYEGYEFFANDTNGKGMSDFYAEMESVCVEFHNNPNLNATYYIKNNEVGDLYEVARLNYSDYGLSLAQAKTVFSIFRKDHPIFYWISYWLYWSGNKIILCTVTEYAQGTKRVACNAIAYKGIEKYVSLADGETSPYNIALIYYEEILHKNSYAYTLNKKPSPAQWAHSIMGAFVYKSFVCEGYAKLFQLLLTVSGVENQYITGEAGGESHAWNLVKMDDGEWYWFDLTWGDTGDSFYKYFCVLDKTMQKHVPTPSNQYGLHFNPTLPDRPLSAFSSDNILEFGEQIKYKGRTYSLCSSGTVRCLNRPSELNPIPDIIIYNGVVYDVSK